MRSGPGQKESTILQFMSAIRAGQGVNFDLKGFSKGFFIIEIKMKGFSSGFLS